MPRMALDLNSVGDQQRVGDEPLEAEAVDLEETGVIDRRQQVHVQIVDAVSGRR